MTNIYNVSNVMQDYIITVDCMQSSKQHRLPTLLPLSCYTKLVIRSDNQHLIAAIATHAHVLEGLNYPGFLRYPVFSRIKDTQGLNYPVFLRVWISPLLQPVLLSDYLTSI